MATRGVDVLGRIRVLELATEIAGPYAGKLLADAGAAVIKVEPSGGDPLRRYVACGATIAAASTAPLFRFLNHRKQIRALDATAPDGRAQLLALLAASDVVVQSRGPGAPFDWATVQAAAPRTSLVSISPFGTDGPWAAHPATEFTLQAWCGSTASRGEVERSPLAAGGRIGEWLGGGYAALGALTAIAQQRRTGEASHVDLSLLEAMHLCMAPFTTVAHSLSGGALAPARTVEIPSIVPTADGFVGLCTITYQQWCDFLVLIGQSDRIGDESLANPFTRNDRRHEVYEFIHAWTRAHTTAEIIERASQLRIPVAPIGNGATVATFDHFRARGVYQPFAGEPAVREPRPPYRLDFAVPPVPAPARPDAAASDPIGTLPFAGLRVLDMTVFWAGPFVGHFLAAMGAEVIKLESIQRPDGMRIASTQQPTADQWWEWSAFFHGINANKRGITLDLSRPEGIALATRLIAAVDVVVENFSPRVLDNLGLRYDELAREHPGLVMIRMPAFGLDGPWRDRTGFAQTMEQVSGMAWVTGFADGPPVIPRGPCDPLAGLHACVALLVALEQRRQTGRGQLVESTMVEAALNVTADQVLEWQTFGRSAAREGNRGPLAAPQGLYRCRGDDRWLALAVTDDTQWVALGEVLGRPEWVAATDLATAAGRRVAHDRIDTALATWAAGQNLDRVVPRLLHAGIPAAPVIPGRYVDGHAQLAARAFFEPVAHDVAGTHELPGLPMRFSSRPGPWFSRPAPTLGQDSAAVLREVLGLDDQQIAGLAGAGIIGDRPVGT